LPASGGRLAVPKGDSEQKDGFGSRTGWIEPAKLTKKWMGSEATRTLVGDA